jgi:hypothetical protein
MVPLFFFCPKAIMCKNAKAMRNNDFFIVIVLKVATYMEQRKGLLKQALLKSTARVIVMHLQTQAG